MCEISGDFITINYKAYLIWYKLHSLCNVNYKYMVQATIPNVYAINCNADVTMWLICTLHGTVKILPVSGLDLKQYFEEPEDGTNF